MLGRSRKNGVASMMTNQRTRTAGMGLIIAASLMAGCTHPQSNTNTPEGTWACTVQWSYERDGVSIACSVQQQSTCVDNILSTRGWVSLGSAQWSETKKGTCFSSAEELFGTWTSVQTVPKNEAARQFEKEMFGGKSLANASKQTGEQHRVRVTSRSGTRIEAVDPNGKAISCTRL